MARGGPSALPRYDLHVHTVYSGHSTPDASVANMILGAAEAGVDVLALTEHVPTVVPEIELWRNSRGDRRVIDAIADDIAGVEPPRGAPALLLGAEVDADPYALDGTLMLEDLSGIDYVLASSHLFPGGEAFWFENVAVAKIARERILLQWVEWMAKVAARAEVSALAHPGALVGARRVVDAFDGDVVDAMVPLLEAMAASSTAFELNELLGRKLPRAARESYPELVMRARALGVRFTVGSDAHGPEGVGLFPWVESVARASGLEADDFIDPPGPRGGA